MTNNQKPHSKQNVFSKKENLLKNAKTHGGVRQDKGAPGTSRIDLLQPAPRGREARAHLLDTKISRTQKHSTKRQTVHVTLWMKPEYKAELQRMAGLEGLNVSSFAGTLLEEAVRQKLHIKHTVLLQPIIEQAIAREMRTISTRLAWLLVRVAFDAGQTRSIVTNILGRQPGVTPDILNTILDGSGKTAKANITRRTPQIIDLIEAVEKWIITREEN